MKLIGKEMKDNLRKGKKAAREGKAREGKAMEGKAREEKEREGKSAEKRRIMREKNRDDGEEKRREGQEMERIISDETHHKYLRKFWRMIGA